MFIYTTLIIALLSLYYLLQKKSSKFNTNTLKNLFEHQNISEQRYYFLYLGTLLYDKKYRKG